MVKHYKFLDVDRRISYRLFLDFEIGLSRAVLKNNPTDLRALQMLGNALTRTKKHKEALKIDKRIIQIIPREPVAHYNLACSYSNLNDIDNAFTALRSALKLGYRDISFIMKDKDLKNLRENPRFIKLISQFRKRKVKK